MNDAISRSAVLNALERARDSIVNEPDTRGSFTAKILINAIDDVSGFVQSVPALDVAPVVHARWIMNHFGAKCSHCLRLYCIEPSWSEKIKHMPPTWIYCPNCGARMDGEADV